jgi:hypothetical protein
MKDTQKEGRKNGRNWKIISSSVDITIFEPCAFRLVPEMLHTHRHTHIYI